MSSMSKSSDSNKRLVPRFDRGSADPFRFLTSLNDASDRSLQLLFFALLDVHCSHLTENDPIKSHRLFQYEIQLLQISKVLPPAMSLAAQSVRQSSWFLKQVRTLRESLQAALQMVERTPMETSDSTSSTTRRENECKQVVLAAAPLANLKIEIPQPDIQLKVPIPLNLNGTMMISDFDNFVLYRYVQDFAELGRVGKGAFGSVFCAQNRLDSCKYAIKKIVFNENNDRTRRQAKHALREVRILASLRHTNVVQYHCAWLELVPVSSHRTPRTSSSSSAGGSGKAAQRPTEVKPMDSLDEMIQFKENSDPQPIVDEHDSQQKGSTTSTSPDDDEDGSEISGSEFTGKDSNVERYHSEGAAAGNQSKASHLSNGSDEKHSNKQLVPLSSRHGPFPPVPRSNLIKAHIVLFIQMQLCDTTLHDWLRFRDRRLISDLQDEKNEPMRSLNDVSQRQCWQIFRQLLTAVDYLHSQSFVHRDIKPRNIFLDIDPNDKTTVQLKLGDFGLATLLDSKITPESPVEWKTGESTGVGTALYAPPEQLNSTGCIVTEKSDTYSLGIVLFELFSVFFTEQERILSLGNLRVQRTVEKTFADHYPFEAMLIEEFIRFDPNDRPNVKTILTTYAKEIQQRLRKSTLVTKQMIIEQLQETVRDKDRRIQQLETELEHKIP